MIKIFFFICVSFFSLQPSGIRLIPRFIGERIFNPCDFRITSMKRFATIPLKDKFSKMFQNKFKTLLYCWMLGSNIHTGVMTIDVVLGLREKKKKTPT